MPETEKVLVTAEHNAPRDGLVLETPAGRKDLQVKLMSRVAQVVVRTVRTYLQSLVGNLGTFGVVGTVAVTTFANLSPEEQAAVHRVYSALEFWQVLVIAASTAIAPAVVSLLQNAIELLAELEKTRPEWRA